MLRLKIRIILITSLLLQVIDCHQEEMLVLKVNCYPLLLLSIIKIARKNMQISNMHL